MSKYHYQGFAMKKEFIDEIKKSIIKSGRYYNVSEFVREAIREKLERIDLCKGDKK